MDDKLSWRQPTDYITSKISKSILRKTKDILSNKCLIISYHTHYFPTRRTG